MSNDLAQAVAAQVQHRDTLTKRDFDVSPGSIGQRTNVASLKASRPLAIVNGAPIDMAIMAYEEKTTDGTASNTETFSLSHDLVESGATSDDLVLYEGGTKVQPDSVDYDADSFDYTDDGTNNTLGVFYASGKQAQVQLQKTAPNGTKETLWTGMVNMLHHRDHDENPVTLDLSASFFQSVIPTNWTLDIYVDAPYVARFEKDIDGDGEAEQAHNALIGLPFLGGRKRIGGLGKAARMDASER